MPVQLIYLVVTVPGSDQRKLTKALGSSADALALDLEDSVAVHKKGEARGLVLE
jgi:citrate lyase beta subunit